MSGLSAAIFEKPKGPDPAIAAAQKRTEARLVSQEKKEQDKLDSQKRAIRASQGSGRRSTLSPLTGIKGVPGTSETLG